MAKFAPSLLALLLMISSAAAVEILNPREARGRCRQEIERQRLSSCRQYLRDGSRFDSTATAQEEEDRRGWREAFPQCCEELEQINHQCRCQAVKKVVSEERQEGALQGREMREMLQTAQSLPSLCRISPHYCENIGQIMITKSLSVFRPKFLLLFDGE